MFSTVLGMESCLSEIVSRRRAYVTQQAVMQYHALLTSLIHQTSGASNGDFQLPVHYHQDKDDCRSTRLDQLLNDLADIESQRIRNADLGRDLDRDLDLDRDRERNLDHDLDRSRDRRDFRHNPDRHHDLEPNFDRDLDPDIDRDRDHDLGRDSDLDRECNFDQDLDHDRHRDLGRNPCDIDRRDLDLGRDLDREAVLTLAGELSLGWWSGTTALCVNGQPVVVPNVSNVCYQKLLLYDAALSPHVTQLSVDEVEEQLDNSITQ